MYSRRDVARHLSYSASARTRGGRALIRLMENATGRLSLIRRAEGFEDDLARGRSVWEVMVARYGLQLDITRGALSNLPASGPLVVVANHPYGILDGLMLGHILSQARGDFRILANSVFVRTGTLDDVILPVDFDDTRQARARNLETRRAALDRLGQGGCIGVFPGGTVATAARPFSHPMDPRWRPFTARLIARSGAPVVPVHFDGHTSRLFQLASHLHPTLRLGLLLREFHRRVDTPVRVAIGAPIPQAKIAARARDAPALMNFLRKATYELSPSPLPTLEYGLEIGENTGSPAADRRRHRGGRSGPASGQEE